MNKFYQICDKSCKLLSDNDMCFCVDGCEFLLYKSVVWVFVWICVYEFIMMNLCVCLTVSVYSALFLCK